MSNEYPETPAPGPVDSDAPGQQLQAAREAMGFSVEQIADQLKLHPRQVRALEAGDYASLPPSAVTRGFVRMYAKAVRLDAAPLVAKLPTDAAAAGAAWHFGLLGAHSAAAPQPATGTEVLPPASQNPTATTPGTVTAPAASPAATPATNANGTLDPSVPLISVPPPGGTNNGSGGTVTAPAADATNGTGAATGTPAAGANAAPAANGQAPAGRLPGGAAQASPAAGTAPAAAAMAPLAGPPTRTAATLTNAPAPSANALVLNVKQDSWIQVKPEAGGTALLSRLVKAGSTETVDITGPVTVTVGNPTGVEATLRGSAVALPQLPGKTIARVNLK